MPVIRVTTAPIPTPKPIKMNIIPQHREPIPQSPSEEHSGGLINESNQGSLLHSVDSILSLKPPIAPFRNTNPKIIATTDPNSKKRPVFIVTLTIIATGLRQYINFSEVKAKLAFYSTGR
jgi:hypothetical protein